MLVAFLSMLLAFASLAAAAPIPAAFEKRFDLVQGHVVAGEGYVPTNTVHLANQPTEIPSVDGGSYFYMPDSLNIVTPSADAPSSRVELANAEFVKRLTPFLLVRPQAVSGDVLALGEITAAEETSAAAPAAEEA